MTDSSMVELPSAEPRRNERGQLMEAPSWLRPAWKKGDVPNPTGAGNAYHQAVKKARGYSPAMVDRMVELAELDNIGEDGKLAPLSRRTDARVALQATDWLWQCAWGKTRSPSVGDDDKPGVTIEQRRDEAMAILQAAFERVIVASKAQEEQAQVVDPIEEGQARGGTGSRRDRLGTAPTTSSMQTI